MLMELVCSCKRKLALGELGSATGGLQTVLLGFLRPQTIGITGVFNGGLVWSPMSHPYRIGNNPTESKGNKGNYRPNHASRENNLGSKRQDQSVSLKYAFTHRRLCFSVDLNKQFEL